MKNLKPNERELIKLTNFFKKRAEKLIQEGQLNEQEQQVTEACENLANSLYAHAANREAVLEKRKKLSEIVKDQAVCPKCNKSTHLKLNGVALSEQGWRSNKYKCRRCNITFTWNRPNNPWDLVPYLRQVIAEMDVTAHNEQLPSQTREHAAYNRDMMQENLAKLEPVLQTSDEELAEMEQREKEMAKLIHEFKNYLLIEKIKMDNWKEPEA
ncbi:hypothetical protein [Adhaeribacter soli]|uniref:Uncharacterized protein n=1 Tax=Adhaeribacter soli TaxID=2607655 RepID=A0A5N1J4B7_9BACT|nr:hypothetical protein [Adhaeribacter soli]KAA9340704.1 hypothetical protein F0P94_04565 [Adhaeribacter soli]